MNVPSIGIVIETVRSRPSWVHGHQVNVHILFPKMALTKGKVLIKGYSDGGMGTALAVAFHQAGYHVYATARDPTKMTQLRLRASKR